LVAATWLTFANVTLVQSQERHTPPDSETPPPVTHASDRFVGRDNVVIARAYTRFDATALFALAGPRLGIAENVTNTGYVTSGAGTVLFAGRPRRIALQLTSAFS
jgi:hypothetical protein